MRLLVFMVVVVVALAGCSIERIEPGGTENSRAEEDSAIQAALDTYYGRFSRRAWDELRESFWPGAVIATRWLPPGASDTLVDVIPLETFLSRPEEGPARLAVFAERMVRHEVRRYGDLAIVWATFEATFGMPGAPPETHYGVDAFQLLADGGTWRIVSLAFTQELPGDSLPRSGP